MLAHVRRLYPSAVVLEPVVLFHSLQDWRARCPRVLKGISDLVFFTTPDGWIGRGVYTEIQAAIAQQIPVRLLASDGSLVPFGRVLFADVDQENWRRYCRVHLLPEDQR